MYSQPITPAGPGCLLFLLDQSFSTAERGALTSAVAAVNRVLADVACWCSAEPCLDVGVLGYTTDAAGRPAVGSSLRGPLAGRALVGAADLAAHPALVSTVRRADGSEEKGSPVWVTAPAATAMLGTPTCAALRRCREIVADWVARHPDSFPPLVVHLTDGEATDGDPEPAADELKSVRTRDGNLLLLSCALAAGAERVLLPCDECAMPDGPARALYRMSSPPPPPARQVLGARGVSVKAGARCVAAPDALPALLGWLDPGAVVLELDDEAITAVAPEPERPAAARVVTPFRPPRCPSCDRKAPGAPGARYCVVCDRKY